MLRTSNFDTARSFLRPTLIEFIVLNLAAPALANFRITLELEGPASFELPFFSLRWRTELIFRVIAAVTIFTVTAHTNTVSI